MIHGRFGDAVPLLVAIRGELEHQRNRRINEQLEEAVLVWSKNAIQVYADRIRAEQEPGKPRVTEAQARVNQLWGRDVAPVMALLQISAAEPMPTAEPFTAARPSTVATMFNAKYGRTW